MTDFLKFANEIKLSYKLFILLFLTIAGFGIFVPPDDVNSVRIGIGVAWFITALWCFSAGLWDVLVQDYKGLVENQNELIERQAELIAEYERETGTSGRLQ